MDAIGLCISFNEYKNLEECLNEYYDIKTLEELNNHAIVIEVKDTGRILVELF